MSSCNLIDPYVFLFFPLHNFLETNSSIKDLKIIYQSYLNSIKTCDFHVLECSLKILRQDVDTLKG